MTPPLPEQEPVRDTAADPELDALLDQTLGEDDVPPYLADRIVEATLPELRRDAGPAPVLARIGPSLKIAMRIAAVVLVGAIVTLALVNAPTQTPDDTTSLAGGDAVEIESMPITPETTEAQFAEALAPLDRVDAALAEVDARREALDAQLSLMALRVEMAGVAPAWSDASAALDASLTAMELEQSDRLTSMMF